MTGTRQPGIALCASPDRNSASCAAVGGCRNILERLPELPGIFQGAPDIVVFE
jgi:hypothetical protein